MSKLMQRVRVLSVEAIQQYRLKVTFDNGTARDLDMEKYLHGPIFEPIRSDLVLFQNAKVAGGTIAWENGADIDPDVLYYDLEPAWMGESESA